MTIHLNGSQNPLDVYYNGASLDTVYAQVGGDSSVFPVWERGASGPETISVAAVMASNGNCIFFRNMTHSSSVLITGVGRGIRYVGDITIETSFNSGRQIGPSLPYSNPYTWSPNEHGLSYSFSGMSGYKFFACSPTAGDHLTEVKPSLTFDVYHNSAGLLFESDRVRTLLDTKLTIQGNSNDYSQLIVKFTTESTGQAWPCLTATSGYIYQGPGTLDVIRA